MKPLSLSRKLWLGSAAVSLGVSLLSAQLVWTTYRDWHRGREALILVEGFHAALLAANRVSAERGPFNSVLGEEPAAHSPSHDRLAQFRARSDAALDDLARHVSADATGRLKALAAPIEQARAQLAAARAFGDATAARPLAGRTPGDVQAVIDAMFAVVGALDPIVSASGAAVMADDSRLAGDVMMARLMGETREYAGQLGSQLIPPLATGQAFDETRLARIGFLLGRLEQLRVLLDRHIALYSGDSRVPAVKADIEQHYFGNGLTLVRSIVPPAPGPAQRALSATEFTSRYVPEMKAVEDLRDTIIGITQQRVEADITRASRLLGSTIAVAASILALVLGLLVAAGRSIFGPLLRVKHELLALAGDPPPPKRPRAPGGGLEVRALMSALDVLHDSRLRQYQVEQDRQVASARLKEQAEHDALTGLLNRRALDAIGRVLASTPAGAPQAIGLILFDLDYFKLVNDTYGHGAGDAVLQEVARRVKANCRAGDSVARFGGEEFAVLVPGLDGAPLARLAEQLRRDIAGTPIALPDGRCVTVSASFGTLAARCGDPWGRMIEHADAALYDAKRGGRNRVVVAAGD